jgi:hypothetical protein
MSEVVSKSQELSRLSQTTFGVLKDQVALPPGSVLHKVWFHVAPAPAVAAYKISVKLVFKRAGAKVGELLAQVTTAPVGVFANWFPVSTDPQTIAENTIAVAYEGDVTSYILFPRDHIVDADTLEIDVQEAKNLGTGANLGGIKFFLAVDSANLPF